MEKSKLDRINELARKAKSVGLTEEETAERDVLRKEYIAAFRANTKATLESILIQEEDGTLTPLKKRNHGEHHHHHEHHHYHHHGEDCCCCGHHHDDEKTIPEQ